MGDSEGEIEGLGFGEGVGGVCVVWKLGWVSRWDKMDVLV
jgi:hypothetical protein